VIDDFVDVQEEQTKLPPRSGPNVWEETKEDKSNIMDTIKEIEETNESILDLTEQYDEMIVQDE